mmetsp:Transcript_28199/g.36377  ORF Transcript_28199/g.36377 Transcript_28199/m.36377 type:complete len:186 (+) Transcript_28199:122-679(+)
MPLCMPLVAVAYKGEVVVGVIHDPHRQETFSAVKGRGATMNGETIKVGEQATIGDAIVAMGSPPAEESMKMSLAALPVLMPKVRTIRMIGSAALMLAWVANGRLTAYWEYDLSSWDVAAGSILIEEAGGSMTDLNNERWNLERERYAEAMAEKFTSKFLNRWTKLVLSNMCFKRVNLLKLVIDFS